MSATDGYFELEDYQKKLAKSLSDQLFSHRRTAEEPDDYILKLTVAEVEALQKILDGASEAGEMPYLLCAGVSSLVRNLPIRLKEAKDSKAFDEVIGTIRGTDS